MKTLASRYFILFIVFMGFFSCGKDQDTPATPGNSYLFTATINGTEWAPDYCKATYNVERHQLKLFASDSLGKYYLTVGISIDSVSPLKKYVLESNGNNVAEVVAGMEQYNTDHNLADAGGSFTLSSLDTLNGTLSGSLQFLSYSGDRIKKLTFSADSLKNIPIQLDTSSYDGSLASCTVNGVKNTRWQSRNFFAKVTCSTITDTAIIDKRLELHIESIVGGYPNHRFILFRIPLNNPAGTYTVYPDSAPYFYCGRMNITSGYWINNIDVGYLATEGNITITQIDTVMKKIKADFNISYKDVAGSGETIQISNGHIELNSWED